MLLLLCVCVSVCECAVTASPRPSWGGRQKPNIAHGRPVLSSAALCLCVSPVHLPLWALWLHPWGLQGWFPNSPRLSWSPFSLVLWRLLLLRPHLVSLTYSSVCCATYWMEALKSNPFVATLPLWQCIISPIHPPLHFRSYITAKDGAKWRRAAFCIYR